MKTQAKTKFMVAGGVGMLAVLGAGMVQAAPHAKIGVARANAIVLKRFPGKLTAKTTLENEEGTWQYGVMVRSGRTLREVMVDAGSGKIANIEATTAGKEKVEAAQEAAVAHKTRHHAARRHTAHGKTR